MIKTTTSSACPTPSSAPPTCDEQLVREHLGLARHLARRYSGRGVEDDDLEQVAALALVKAARGYDPARGAFAPFAGATVRGELKRYFRDLAWSVRPPRRLQELQAAIGAGGGWSGRSPASLAGELDVAEADVEEALAAKGCYHADSLERSVPGSTLSLGDSIPSEDGAMGMVEEWVTFCEASRTLDDAARELLRLRFVEDLTQQDIADRLGVSQMQVSRRLRSVLEALRASATGSPVAA